MVIDTDKPITDNQHAVVLGLYLMSEGLQENPDYEKMARVKADLEAYLKLVGKA